MGKLRYNFLFIAILIFTKSMVSAQVLPNVQNAFNNYQQQVFQEKIFVHTDKEVYVMGELLWFKVYNVDATNNQPVNLSKVAYVEVLDQNNNQILQAKIELKDGSGSGSFYVPITILNGTYKLRAYTNWMQNFGANHFFEKQLKLINPLKAATKQNSTKSSPDLQFFPEGGDLIEGVASNVGFKALGTDGNGLEIKGSVINQKNDTVARFKSLKFGIGRFAFTPLANQIYKVIAISAKGEIINKELPKVKLQGATIRLTNNGGKLSLNFATNSKTDKVYLLAHSGKTITIAQSASLTDGKTTFEFNEEQLNDGVNHLTVFNEAGLPMSERLFFKKPVHQLIIQADPDRVQYTVRKNVNITIAAVNEKNEGQLPDLSIAVHRLDSLQGVDPHNILSYFWLQSELKGNIESPNYYFSENTAEIAQALDNLLLTQGWSRFNWTEVLANKSPIFKFLPEYNGHLINGTATDLKGLPVKNTKIYMSVPGKRVQFYGAESDSTGNYKFNTKDFYGANELVLQTNYGLDSTSVLTIKSPFSQQFSTFDYPVLTIMPNMLGALRQYSLGAQTQHVFASSKLKQFYFPGIDSASFYGTPFKIYKLDDYVRFGTMEEVLREYVKEVFVSKRQKKFHLKVLGAQNLLYGDPLVLLDGVPYFNIDKAIALDPIKIEKLGVVNQSYFYGTSLFEGILSFSSYKGNLADIPLDPRAIVLDYEGMQLQREFYIPAYETPEQINSRIPDFRNQLFWSPSVILDKTGKGKINFNTSDLPGTYVGIIEGLTSNGIPGSKTFTFEVKK